MNKEQVNQIYEEMINDVIYLKRKISIKIPRFDKSHSLAYNHSYPLKKDLKRRLYESNK